MAKLVDVLGAGEVAQASCPEMCERDLLGKAVNDEVVSRPREKRLAAVADRPQSRAAVDRRPDVVALVAELHFAGVQGQPQAELQATGPGLAPYGELEG